LLTAAPEEGAEQPAEATDAPEAPKAPSAEEQQFASKFAALSRKEKQIRERERQMVQQMAEIEKRMKEIESGSAEVQKFKDLPGRLKKEPLKVLEESGLTFEQLAQMVLNDGAPTPDMQIKEALSPFEKQIEELKKKLEEKEAKEQEEKLESALQKFMGQITDLVNNDPNYELIRANDAVNLVYEVIEQHHSETGEILGNKEAADAVEEYLLEEAKKLIDRDKVKKLMGAGSDAKKPAQGKPQVTLSNDQVSQSPKGKHFLSDEESRAEAAKLIRWVE